MLLASFRFLSSPPLSLRLRTSRHRPFPISTSKPSFQLTFARTGDRRHRRCRSTSRWRGRQQGFGVDEEIVRSASFSSFARSLSSASAVCLLLTMSLDSLCSVLYVQNCCRSTEPSEWVEGCRKKMADLWKERAWFEEGSRCQGRRTYVDISTLFYSIHQFLAGILIYLPSFPFISNSPQTPRSPATVNHFPSQSSRLLTPPLPLPPKPLQLFPSPLSNQRRPSQTDRCSCPV